MKNKRRQSVLGDVGATRFHGFYRKYEFLKTENFIEVAPSPGGESKFHLAILVSFPNLKIVLQYV